MTLHELYLDVKQQVAAAVAAVNEATIAAAVYTEQTIADALAAVRALDDYLDFFGLVGSPMDAGVNLLIDQLLNLAMALDNRGYYAIYQQTFGAANQYRTAKSSYNGFTGGLGGKSGGGGASGSWGEADPLISFPWYQCFNRNGATLCPLSSSAPPPEDAIDFTVLLGPCSEVFVYADDHPNGYWQAGVYQYARLRIWVRFVDMDVIFDNDYGDTPDHPTYSLGYNYIIEDRTVTQYFQASFPTSDWTGVYYNQPVPTWPYDTADRIVTADGESIRDVQWDIKGRHHQWDNDYWLYTLSYWEVWEVAGIPDGLGGFYQCGKPEQLQFLNPCTPPPGTDFPAKPIPFPIPLLFTDNQKRKKAMNALRLKLEFKPYEVMCNGEKILCDGQQITCGDVE